MRFDIRILCFLACFSAVAHAQVPTSCPADRPYFLLLGNQIVCSPSCLGIFPKPTGTLSGISGLRYPGKFCVQRCEADYPFESNGACVQECPDGTLPDAAGVCKGFNGGIVQKPTKCPESRHLSITGECVDFQHEEYPRGRDPNGYLAADYRRRMSRDWSEYPIGSYRNTCWPLGGNTIACWTNQYKYSIRQSLVTPLCNSYVDVGGWVRCESSSCSAGSVLKGEACVKCNAPTKAAPDGLECDYPARQVATTPFVLNQAQGIMRDNTGSGAYDPFTDAGIMGIVCGEQIHARLVLDRNNTWFGSCVNKCTNVNGKDYATVRMEVRYPDHKEGRSSTTPGAGSGYEVTVQGKAVWIEVCK